MSCERVMQSYRVTLLHCYIPPDQAIKYLLFTAGVMCTAVMCNCEMLQTKPHYPSLIVTVLVLIITRPILSIALEQRSHRIKEIVVTMFSQLR